MSHSIRFAGGVFSQFHQELMGTPIDFSTLDLSGFSDTLLQEARDTWQSRVHSEFRSVQIMNQFLSEVLGAGDPLDVYAGAVDLVADEIKHTALCVQVCLALGIVPVFPDHLPHQSSPAYLASPMSERALATAISMVAINETLSVGFVSDLAQRCTTPGIADVLRATVGDEAGHQEFGWSYIRQSLQRFPASTIQTWRQFVYLTLSSHVEQARTILQQIPEHQQHLDVWPDRERAALGLFCPERQALVFLHTYRHELLPRLQSLQLIDDEFEVFSAIG